ncbi:MAG: zinc ribbon domain-containing protein [bacterium]
MENIEQKPLEKDNIGFSTSIDSKNLELQKDNSGPISPDISETNLLCPICHQPVSSKWYFCPNCGNKLDFAPLPTSTIAQIKLYAFSIILPVICFLMITKWQGLKYLRSKDQKTRSIGITACTLLIVSTIITVWLAVVWTEEAIQSSIDSINADMSF